jgi:hypothetical protein
MALDFYTPLSLQAKLEFELTAEDYYDTPWVVLAFWGQEICRWPADFPAYSYEPGHYYQEDVNRFVAEKLAQVFAK